MEIIEEDEKEDIIEDSERPSFQNSKKDPQKEGSNFIIDSETKDRMTECVPDVRYTQVEYDFLSSHIEGYNEDINDIDSEEKSDFNSNNIIIGGSAETSSDSALPNNSQRDSANNYIQEIKIIILGEYNVGKTSLIDRYINNKFSTNNFPPTLSLQNNIKKIKIDEYKSIKLNIFDTSGEERYSILTKNYFTDAYGALLVFDLCNKNSFEKIKKWLNELLSHTPKDIIYCIIGNKSDKKNERQVSYEEGKDFAGDNLYYETSAKSGLNVSLAFEQLAYEILEKQNEEKNNPDKIMRGKEGRNTIELHYFEKHIKPNKKGWCCK